MMKRYNKLLHPAFFVIDLFIVIITFLTVVLFKFDFNWPTFAVPTYLLLGELVGIFWILNSIIFKTYQEDPGNSLILEIRKLVFASLASVFLITSFLFIIKDHFYSRIIISSHAILSFLLLAIWHAIRHSILTSYRRRGLNFVRVLLIGEGITSERIHNHIRHHPEEGYRIEEYVNNNNHPSLNSSEIEHELITTLSESIKIDEIILTVPLPLSMNLEMLILEADNIGTRVSLGLDHIISLHKRYNLQEFDGIPIINIRHEPLRSKFNLVIKRVFDIIISSLAILLIFPLVLPFVSLIIIFYTKENPFFSQQRIGISGTKFNCIKFRTMKLEESIMSNPKSEYDNGSVTESANDLRITKIGGFLRKSNLDELPQFINVIMNQMSLVGPRPHMVSEDIRITQLIQRYKVRQYIKPGITGWAAINGYRGGTTNLELMQKRIDYDIWYLENWTIWLDVMICAKTLWNLIRLKNMGH